MAYTHRAEYTEKVALAKVLRAATVTASCGKLIMPREFLTDVDDVDRYIIVNVEIDMTNTAKRPVVVRFQLKTKEFDPDDRNDVWYKICKSYDENVTPSSYKIKEVRVAFTTLMAKVYQAASAERGQRPAAVIRKSLNSHLRRKKHKDRIFELKRATNIFEELLEDGGFQDINEEQLLEIYRTFKIKHVMNS